MAPKRMFIQRQSLKDSEALKCNAPVISLSIKFVSFVSSSHLICSTLDADNTCLHERDRPSCGEELLEYCNSKRGTATGCCFLHENRIDPVRLVSTIGDSRPLFPRCTTSNIPAYSSAITPCHYFEPVAKASLSKGWRGHSLHHRA